MVKIIIEGQTFSIPERWEEITVGQYMAMVRDSDNLTLSRLISILTGIDYDTLVNTDCSQFGTNVLPSLPYLQGLPDLKTLPRKERITINGSTIEVIKDPSKERIGQKLYMMSLLGDGDSVKVYEIIPSLIANYYAPKLHPEGKWDDAHVERIANAVYEMPLFDALPEVGFFLLGYKIG